MFLNKKRLLIAKHISCRWCFNKQIIKKHRLINNLPTKLRLLVTITRVLDLKLYIYICYLNSDFYQVRWSGSAFFLLIQSCRNSPLNGMNYSPSEMLITFCLWRIQYSLERVIFQVIVVSHVLKSVAQNNMFYEWTKENNCKTNDIMHN